MRRWMLTTGLGAAAALIAMLVPDLQAALSSGPTPPPTPKPHPPPHRDPAHPTRRFIGHLQKPPPRRQRQFLAVFRQ